MTGDEMLATYVRLTADLYQQLEDEQEAHLRTAKRMEEMRAEALEREQRIAELHDHVAVLERPARVPSCGPPPL